MRTILLLVAASFVAACILDGGKRGEPAFRERPLQTFVQVRVVGAVVIETGNPEIPNARYGYRALESIDTTALELPLHLVTDGRGPDHFPYEGQKKEALENARTDVLARIGTCAKLADATAETEGDRYAPRSVNVVVTSGAAAGVELTEEQLAGLCNGGVLP